MTGQTMLATTRPSGEALSATAVWLLAVIGFFLLGTELALVGSLRHKGKMIVDDTTGRNETNGQTTDTWPM